MLIQIILFIIFVILICIVISSIDYSSENSKMYKSKDVKIKGINLGSIKTEIINNCHILSLKNIQDNIAYLIEGNFSNSCLSLYKNNERIHSRLINGEKSFVLSPNLNLTSQVFKGSKFKSELLPLEINNDYTISVNNVNDISVKNYTVNYKIDSNPINYTYEKGVGLNEYDIVQEIKEKYSEFERFTFRNVEKENKWVFKNSGSFILVILKNLHNIDMTINGVNHTIRKSDDISSYEIIPIQDPDIIAFNLDFKTRIKGINKEYIEFITSPSHLMSKFLYGSKTKEIDYISQINDKLLVFKIKQV